MKEEGKILDGLVVPYRLHQEDFAQALGIPAAERYENSTENMALSIDGLYSINDIKRESFAKEAAFVGLGTQMAVKRFDMMVSKFESAMQNAKTELEKQGYEDVESIYDKIMKKGGIKFYRV